MPTLHSLGTWDLLSGLCGMGMGILLGIALAVPAEASAPPLHADTLTAAAVAFTLRYDARPSSPSTRDDRWWARDKAVHLAGSALWTLSTQYVLVSKTKWTEGDALPVSVASGVAVGATKELYDATHPSGTASVRDLVADAVGIGLAAGVIAL
jgi:uncharacterized protein YfiM (DUF2279 family)